MIEPISPPISAAVDPSTLPPIETLTPHTGRMRLIARVLACDDVRIICEAESHRSPDNPLRRHDQLPPVCALEYGAQAMAIHGALLAGLQDKPRVGYLVAAHELRRQVQRLDTLAASLRIEATRLFGSDTQVAYRFELTADGSPVMSGRASVVLSAG